MPVALESGDRRILIAAAALLVVLTSLALLLSPDSDASSRGFPSSYSASSDGAKAAYLLLDELGYPVERWEKPPADLPEEAGNTLLVLADPFIPPSAEEKWRIQKFISDGGRVLASGALAKMLLPESNIQMPKEITFEPETFRARLPGPITRQAPEIELQAGTHWSARQARHLHYFGDEDGGVVVSYRLGRGQVVWWAGSEPLANFGLDRASNLILFLNSVGASRPARILWDEYFHGQRPGLFAYLARTPAPWALVQFIGFAAAVLFTFSRRSGPVRALAAAGTRLSPLEFVETLGDLYRVKRAAPAALDIAFHRFRYLLLPRLGLPAAATLVEIVRGVQDRWGRLDPDFVKVLSKCERSRKGTEVTEPEALALIRELHDYTRRWQLRGGTRGD